MSGDSREAGGFVEFDGSTKGQHSVGDAGRSVPEDVEERGFEDVFGSIASPGNENLQVARWQSSWWCWASKRELPTLAWNKSYGGDQGEQRQARALQWSGRWGSHRGELEFGILATPTRYRPFETYSIYRGVPPKRSKDTDPSQPLSLCFLPFIFRGSSHSHRLKSCPKIQNASSKSYPRQHIPGCHKPSQSMNLPPKVHQRLIQPTRTDTSKTLLFVALSGLATP